MRPLLLVPALLETAVVTFVFPEDTQEEVQLLLCLFFQRTHRRRYSCCYVCFSRGHTGGGTALVRFVFPEDTQEEVQLLLRLFFQRTHRGSSLHQQDLGASLTATPILRMSVAR